MTAQTAFAGPPTKAPDAGPPAETRTALAAETTPGDGDSVYRITRAGSYVLTANLQGAAGKSGIEIAASNVTLDLNGYTLQGIPTARDGICIDGSAAFENLTVRNGAVVGWGRRPDAGPRVLYGAGWLSRGVASSYSMGEDESRAARGESCVFWSE